MSTIRLAELVRSFHIGGTESQVVELLRALPDRYQLQVGVLSEEGPLLESVWKLGHLPMSFPLSGTLAHPGTALQIARCAWWLADQRIQLVHAHDFYSAAIGVPAAKLAGARVIVGRLDLAHWYGKARRALLTQLTRTADHVVVNASAIRDMLVEQEQIPERNITLIRNGLDLARFDRLAEQGLDAPLPVVEGAPVVAHVANMNHEVKRQEDVLAALALLRERGQTLHVFFVGDGPRRRKLEALAQELRVADRAHFLGHRSDVPAIYARCQMGVLCSTAEGTSNALMEGMAAGLPMIATRVGGSPDLIADGERGLLIDAVRPDQLMRAFERLMNAPEQGRRMGERARAFVERELSLSQLAERHDEMYRAILLGRSGAAQPAFALNPAH